MLSTLTEACGLWAAAGREARNKKASALCMGMRCPGFLEEVSRALEEGKDLARLMAAEEIASARHRGRRECKDCD